jgi:hypothetical protein
MNNAAALLQVVCWLIALYLACTVKQQGGHPWE